MVLSLLAALVVSHGASGADDGGVVHDDDHDDHFEHDAGFSADSGIEPSTVVRARRDIGSASEFSISSQVIQAAPRTGASDLLRLVPGLVASQHSGTGKAHQLFLRGFDAVHGQDIELNVAGLPVNEVSHLHALGYADVNWLIPEVVSQIHAWEGASRAFQGDFATAGTVKFDLGLAEAGLLAKGTYGSFGAARVLLGIRPFDDATSFAALELAKSDGYGPERASSRASFISQFVHTFGDIKARAVATAYATNFSSPGVLRDDDFRAGRVGFFDGAAAGQGGGVSRFQVLAGAEKSSDHQTLLMEAYALRIDTRLRNNFTGTLLSATGDGLEQVHGVTTVGVKVQDEHQWSPGGTPLTLTVALQGRRDEAQQNQRKYRDSDGAAYGDSVDARFIQSALTAWAELSWKPEHWFLLLGGRADALAFETFDAILNGKTDLNGGTGISRSAFGVHPGLKVGITRFLGSNFQLLANYGDGFRSPQARSLAQGEKAPFVNSRGGDVGAVFTSRKVTAQVAGFVTWLQDDLFFDHVTGTTISAGSSIRGGGTLNIITRPVEPLMVSANLTLADARLADGTRLPYFAPVVGRLDASWSDAFKLFTETFSWKVGTAFTAIGPRPLRFDDMSRPVFLLDATAQLRWRMLAVTLDVTNVADARWRDGEFTFASRVETQPSASQLPARQFTAGAPRQFFLSVQVNP